MQLTNAIRLDEHGNLWKGDRIITDPGLDGLRQNGHSTALTGEKITYWQVGGFEIRRFESAGKVWWCLASATVKQVEQSFRELERIKREQPEAFAFAKGAK